jgi:hypothetical protein
MINNSISEQGLGELSTGIGPLKQYSMQQLIEFVKEAERD